MLDDRQLECFQRDGYLVIEDFMASDTRTVLRERALELVDRWEPGARPENSVFTTDEQDRATTDEFLASASLSWCFFETGAIDPDGSINRPRRLSINKIGHAMHDLDPVFESATYTRELAELTVDLGLRDALALQSMYIFKQPGIGGEVGCHQDATYLYTDPITVTGFWFAIEDATIDNGCLWAAPGAHRSSLRQVFERTGATDGQALTRFRELDATPLPTPGEGLVPLEVPAGTLVVLDGLLPHWSDVNRSPQSRHAYTVHCIDGTADYPQWNWLQRDPELPLRRVGEVAR